MHQHGEKDGAGVVHQHGEEDSVDLVHRHGEDDSGDLMHQLEEGIVLVVCISIQARFCSTIILRFYYNEVFRVRQGAG